MGGTGNFFIKTRKGNNLIDETYIFGVLGVSGVIVDMTSTIVSIDATGVSNAGEPSKYNFAFKTNYLIPFNSYLELWIPLSSGFGISDYPSCSTFPINGNQILGTI